METSTTFCEKEKNEKEKSIKADYIVLCFITIVTAAELIVYYMQNVYYQKLFEE